MESNSITGAAIAPAKEAPGQPKPAQPKKSKAEQLEAEVLKLSRDLDKAETNSEKIGRKFGEKLIELRDLRKKEKTQDWMAYLDQVVKVSYDKARYWINVVEGKSNHRHHGIGAAPNGGGGSGRSVFQRPLKDWWDAQKRLNDLLVPLKALCKKGNKGSDMLVPALKELAAIAGCTLVEPPKSPKYPEPAPENFAAQHRAKPTKKSEKTRTKAQLDADVKKAEDKVKQKIEDEARKVEIAAATDAFVAPLAPYSTDENGKPEFLGKQDSEGEQIVQ